MNLFRILPVAIVAAVSGLAATGGPVWAAAGWPTGHIGWGDTTAGGCGTTQDLRYDCAAAPETTLVVSFTAPAGVDSLYAVDFHVDFCTAPNVLPEWWRFDLAGGCREGALSLTADFTNGPSTHVDPWNGGASVSWTFTPGHLDPVRARIDAQVTLDAPGAISLTEGTEVYVAKLVFAAPSSLPCTGCSWAGCFMLNDQVTLHHAGGTTAVVSSYLESFAWFQGGNWGCPFIVSVDPASWGRVKSLYD